MRKMNAMTTTIPTTRLRAERETLVLVVLGRRRQCSEKEVEKRLKRVADEARKTNTKPSRAFTGWLREEKRDFRATDDTSAFWSGAKASSITITTTTTPPPRGDSEPERGERQSVVCRPGGGVFLRFTRSWLVGTPLSRVLLDGVRRQAGRS